MTISERDWKTWRKLRELALERFCKQTLDSITQIGNDANQSSHARYLQIYELISQRDKLLARSFDPHTRSYALGHIMSMQVQKLLTAGELASFSEEIQEILVRQQDNGH